MPAAGSNPAPSAERAATSTTGQELHEDVALLDDVAGRDLDGGHDPGRLGEHRDLHLHRLQQAHRVAGGHLVVDGDLDHDHVGHHLGQDPYRLLTRHVSNLVDTPG